MEKRVHAPEVKSAKAAPRAKAETRTAKSAPETKSQTATAKSVRKADPESAPVKPARRAVSVPGPVPGRSARTPAPATAPPPPPSVAGPAPIVAPTPAPAAPPPAPAAPAPREPKRSAVSLAKKQREISVSEFFEKNRHLLGFDSPAKALLTAVKEAVDNALDACEEAGVLPSITVELTETAPNTRYRLAVQDNGPGIVKAQIPKVFGKLLYGSKFHRLKQSRGQQGIGISAAGLYGLLTTGKPIVITSRTGKRAPAHHFELVIDTKRNEPHVIVDRVIDDWPVEHGTRVEIELAGAYKAGRRSIDEYLEQTALANPHAEFSWSPPRERSKITLPRVVEQLPPEPEEVKPHPHGVELGVFLRMLRDAGGRTLSSVLTQDFSRVSARLAAEIVTGAGFSPRNQAGKLSHDEGERLYQAVQSAKLIAPSTSSVVPIGEPLIQKGLEREAPRAELYVTRSRPPKVYRGNPFLVEVGLAYGGEAVFGPAAASASAPSGLLDHVGAGGEDGRVWVAGIALEPQKALAQALMAVPGMTRAKSQDICQGAQFETQRKVSALTADDIERLRHAVEADLRSDAASRPIELVRLANRVPLQYQQSACAITQAVIDTNWKRYGLAQPRGGLPAGPLVLVVHIASVWVPFTSESKEAIAHYPEIVEEIQRGLMECGRQLGAWLNKRAQAKVAAARRDKIELYAGELVEALHALTGRAKEKIKAALEIAQRKNLGEMDGEEEAAAGGEEKSAAGKSAVNPAEGEQGEG